MKEILVWGDITPEFARLGITGECAYKGNPSVFCVSDDAFEVLCADPEENWDDTEVCWHPVFPGRVDDIWLMAATAAKAVEQALTGPPGNPVLYVYEQQETDGAFGGVRMVSRQVKP